MVDRIVGAESTTVITAYERKIQTLEANKIALDEKIKQCGAALPDYDETFRTALDFLANPYRLWASERLESERR